MRNIINGICVILGFVAFGFGVIGIVLPILPTTPFLLLAAVFFAKGSNKFHQWFTSTSVYIKYIECTVKKKEMTAKAKKSVLFMITCLLLLGFVLSPVWYAKMLIACILIFHYYYFLVRIKTIQGFEGEEEISRQDKYQKKERTNTVIANDSNILSRKS